MAVVDSTDSGSVSAETEPNESNTVQASLEVIEELEKLLKEWHYSKENQRWLLGDLLPQLKSDPASGTRNEKQIIGRLKLKATEAEWRQLEAIAKDLVHQRAAIEAAARKLDHHFASEQFAEAEAFARDSGQPSIQRLHDQIRQRVANSHMVAIAAALGKHNFQEAERHYEAIQPVLEDTQRTDYLARRAQAVQEFTDLTVAGIKEACASRDYKRAEALYSRPGHTYSQTDYNALVDEYRQRQAEEDRARFVASTLATMWKCIESYDFDGAEAAYAQVRGECPEELYHQRVAQARTKQARENLLDSITHALDASDFAAADQFYHSSDLIEHNDYLGLKAPYVQAYAEERYSQAISLEQARALSSPSHNLLVKARAGSGKTRLLACKAAMLIDAEGVEPDEILVMAFNRSAAADIRERIRGTFKQASFDNARTFHSLAHRLVNPQERLLYDDSRDVVTQAQTGLVQELIGEHLEDPAFSELAYTFFREEMQEITQAGSGLPDAVYLQFRRNLRQVTLNGDRVKSTGEKYIADFLFEHDIAYAYEKTRLWGTRVYRPDFTIWWQDHEYVIEHWGIDEHDRQKRVPPEWTTTWEQYVSDMRRKRAYWADQPTTLIETSICDLRSGRDAFEAVLARKLAEVGLLADKLTPEALQQKVRTNDRSVSRMASLFTDFIQRAKKNGLTAQETGELAQSYSAGDDREAAFLELAPQIYASYEETMLRRRYVDFDEVVARAIGKINATRGECTLPLDSAGGRSVRIKDLKWILIDEYQDFSELFYRLVDAIRSLNPEVRLYCVGDDWQAINGFAGSDVRYFREFHKHYENAHTAHVTMNHRSRETIVRLGNALMEGNGTPVRYASDRSGGEFSIDDINSVWVELRSDDEVAEARNNDERFYVTQPSPNSDDDGRTQVVASKYLRKCHDIILQAGRSGGKFAILSRTNRIDGIPLTWFQECLLTSFTEDERQALGHPCPDIDVSTVHKYKGGEASTVVVLEACNGKFPLLHPDTTLLGIFGESLQKAFEEERRLFYVAVTRAEESLYILTERGEESVFLQPLGAVL